MKTRCRVARTETRGIFLSNSCSLCHRNQLEHVMPTTSHGNLFKSGAPHIHILSQSTTILLVVRSANTVTSKASCKVNLLKTILTHEFVHHNHSCQPSRFHRESPEIFSISRLPPGLHICNSISRDCYLSLHTCIDKTPSFCKALVSACSKVQLEARHYNTSCERVHIIT